MCIRDRVTYPDFVADTAQAVAWTLDHIGAYGGDAGRVFLAGHSAGGYNAAMVALDPRWLARFGHSPQQLKGWIGMAGPYEFLPIVSRTLRPIFHFPDTPPDSQPVVHAGADAPPTLLMAGTDDTLVDPVRNTRALADALRRAGARVEQVEYPGLGHQMLAGALARPLRWRAPVLDDLSRFVLHPCLRACRAIRPEHRSIACFRSAGAARRPHDFLHALHPDRHEDRIAGQSARRRRSPVPGPL